MKKLCALIVLAIFAQAQSTIVQLTEEEKVLRDKVTESWGYGDKDYRAFNLHFVLYYGCGTSEKNRADNYDSDEHPDCKRVLDFLKTYAQAIKDHNPYEIDAAKVEQLAKEVSSNYDARQEKSTQ